MELKRRLKKLEQVTGINEVSGDKDAHQQRWNEAYRKLALTMREDHFVDVHNALIEFYESDAPTKAWEYIPSFLAARVYRLSSLSAAGFHAVLKMPPELAELWIAFERDCGPFDPYSSRYSAHHSYVECADCGAEFPQLRPRHWSREVRDFVGPSRDYVDACLFCGCAVGFYSYRSERTRIKMCGSGMVN